MSEKLKADIFDILKPKFYHPHAPIKKTTLSRLRLPELSDLYSFLKGEMIISDRPSQRPSCPMETSRHHALATYAYKQGMVQYISGFGYNLVDRNVCNYSPAFLEALANYCEYIAEMREGEKKVDEEGIGE